MKTLTFQKRLVLYQNCIKHFMDFFETRDNIVTVDVSSGHKEAIWVKVCDFFSQFDFQSTRIVESVIIFGFGEFQEACYNKTFSLKGLSV